MRIALRRSLVIPVAAALSWPVVAGSAAYAGSTAYAGGATYAHDGARIPDIQGTAQLSPLAGETVSAVPGVVIATDRNGFWMQDPHPDGDPATSEGIFAFDRDAGVTVGDAVEVDGQVNEFRPGGEATNLTQTEIEATAVRVVSSGNPLPAPTVIGTGGRVPPTHAIEDDADGDVETSGVFDPRQDGLDFYESLEGMRVEVDHAVAVGPTNQFGEIPVVGDGAARASVRTARGGVVLRERDPNPERVFLDDSLADTPTVDVGDRFTSPAVGVMSYSFGNFKLEVTATSGVDRRGLPREQARPARPGELAVATFNVENLDPGDPEAKFDALAANVVTNLRSPDVLAVEEVQDNSGPSDDGIVAADETVARLVAAIEAAGGPAYEWRDTDPENDRDGGQPGGNIRVGFLFRTDRGLAFIDRPGGDATTATHVVPDAGGARLTASPGRIDPTDPAFTDSRKPLAGEFTWQGRKLFVIANHWNSKGGDQPLFGRFQPPQLASETQRVAQAQVVAGFVREVHAVDPGARVVVAGDLNDFPYSPPLRELTAAGLRDLPAGLPLPQRYSYVFEGNSQVLDHILLSPSLAHGPYAYDIVHVNAEYADQTSDHDPQVVRLRP